MEIKRKKKACQTLFFKFYSFLYLNKYKLFFFNFNFFLKFNK